MDESKVRSITLRPPPGTRFSIFGADCVLQYQRGREKEVLEWLQNWIKSYVEPLMRTPTVTVTHIDDSPAVTETKATDVNSTVAAYAHVTHDPELDADENFKPALCLSCEKNPIKHLSGLCDACHTSAKETVDSLPDDEANNSESEKKGE